MERNLERYFEIITELLGWHERKMKEHPKKEKPVEKFVPEFPEPEERPEAEQTAKRRKALSRRLKRSCLERNSRQRCSRHGMTRSRNLHILRVKSKNRIPESTETKAGAARAGRTGEP